MPILLRWTKPAGILSLIVVASCNLLTPLVFIGEHKKRVSPEFDRLARSRVAVLVWTDPATLFDYPHARFELAAYVGEKLAGEMAKRSQSIELVDPREVEDYLQREIDAQVNPMDVGHHFDVDYVIYLEIFQFQIRDPQTPELLRGRVDASVTVHDIRAVPARSARYELTPVRCTYPEHGQIILNATNAPLVRRSTYQKFAEQVSRKFYEYTVDL